MRLALVYLIKSQFTPFNTVQTSDRELTPTAYQIRVPLSEVKLSLENFRNEMDERVQERGWFYFSKGWVRKPTEVLPGFFESVVTEVNPHAISYSIEENGEVNDVFCTCGDEAWCRHLAAVLYLLDDQQKEILPENEHIIT